LPLSVTPPLIKKVGELSPSRRASGDRDSGKGRELREVTVRIRLYVVFYSPRVSSRGL